MVSMDFERFKASLRLHTGRSKKLRKAQVQDEEKRRTPLPLPAEHTLVLKKDSPTLRLYDRMTALPPVETDINLAPSSAPSSPDAHQTYTAAPVPRSINTNLANTKPLVTSPPLSSKTPTRLRQQPKPIAPAMDRTTSESRQSFNSEHLLPMRTIAEYRQPPKPLPSAIERMTPHIPLPSKPPAAKVDRTNSDFPQQSKPMVSNPEPPPPEPRQSIPNNPPRLVPKRSRSDLRQPYKPDSQKPKRRISEPAAYSSSGEEADDFDLRPPPPRQKAVPVEALCELLFSDIHLDTTLRNAQLFVRFTAFLNRYRPQAAPLLMRYLETQKAIKAVEYANAVAESIAPLPEDSDSNSSPPIAAQLEGRFEKSSKNAFDTLVAEALPAYITYSLVKIVTECMVNDIMGRSTPMMRDLVRGMSEVFCLTDPSQKDNPIIYASNEFYRMTGYHRDYVIGRNCRFLQGPKTARSSPFRIKQALDAGQEISETILNYRRDGTPFINLLMTAPLYDNKGNVKYFIGAQVDVSDLVQDGRGIDGFDKSIAADQAKQESGSKEQRQRVTRENLRMEEGKKKGLTKLRELSEMFDLEESIVVQSHSRRNSMTSRADDERSTTSMSVSRNNNRRIFVDSFRSDDDDDDDDALERERAAWSLSQTAPSGKLPGVYQNYFLLRPAPSLRVIFVSPALRKMGFLHQSRIMQHIYAPVATLSGLQQSFEAAVPVTAKVSFSPVRRNMSRNDDRISGANRRNSWENNPTGEDAEEDLSKRPSRTCWISATPLLGSDDQVGVWMVVLVEKKSNMTVVQRSAYRSGPLQGTMSGRESRQSERAPTRPSSSSRNAKSPPIPQMPVPAPIPQMPVSAPIPQMPISGPMPQTPVSAPMSQMPVSSPIPQMPIPAPSYLESQAEVEKKTKMPANATADDPGVVEEKDVAVNGDTDSVASYTDTKNAVAANIIPPAMEKPSESMAIRALSPATMTKPLDEMKHDSDGYVLLAEPHPLPKSDRITIVPTAGEESEGKDDTDEADDEMISIAREVSLPSKRNSMANRDSVVAELRETPARTPLKISSPISGGETAVETPRTTSGSMRAPSGMMYADYLRHGSFTGSGNPMRRVNEQRPSTPIAATKTMDVDHDDTSSQGYEPRSPYSVD